MSHGSPVTTSSNVLADIVWWSTCLPLWQQGALRRIIGHDGVSADDVGELVALYKREAGIAIDGEQPNPPDVSLLCVPSEQNVSVSLVEIAAVQNVNAMCDQRGLTFGSDGLTVIYWIQRLWKSGYNRVLQRARRQAFGQRADLAQRMETRLRRPRVR